MINTLERDGYVDEPWRIAPYRSAKAGDRVWVLSRGKQPRGVFGVGEIIDQPAPGVTSDGKMHPMATVRFTKLVDPSERLLLIGEQAVRQILAPTQLNARKSGYPLKDEQAAALEELVFPNETEKQRGSGDWTPEELSAAPHAPPSAIDDTESVFVPPPTRVIEVAMGRAITRPVPKTDLAVRDAANHALGEAGERFVLSIEQARLTKAGCADLAAKVKWASKDDGDGLGYDIVSFTGDGQEIYIEVKTTKRPIETPFFLSENERRCAAEKGPTFRLYRLFDFGSDSKIYTLTGPLDGKLMLEPFSYRATVGGRRE